MSETNILWMVLISLLSSRSLIWKSLCTWLNSRFANFLDVQFNLNNSTYQTKPDNTPVHIKRKSNHPPVVLKRLPKSIAKRISDISSGENIFCNSIPIYSEALKKSGFNDKLTYSTKTADCDTSEKKKRKRKSTIQSTIFIKCENKRKEKNLEACKETFSRRKSSTQDSQ